MRTSTKIFFCALFLLGCCLAVYDWMLAAEYRKGEYTDPYYTFTKLNYRNFDEVELRAATSVNLMLVQGDFKVLEHRQAPEFVVIRQEGKRLIIEAKFADHYRQVFADHTLFISCPRLSAFRADAKYTIGELAVTDYTDRNIWRQPTVIRGFGEDSLTILEDHASNLVLEGNKIKRLVAVVGKEEVNGDGGPGSGSGGESAKGIGGGAVSAAGDEGEKGQTGPVLTIGQGNHFDSSDLNILGKGRLWIKGTDMRQLTYHLADSATLTVNGVSARYLNLH